jgi:nitrate reductase assembly molybdenum cofactor insertion protein NarJ
MKKHLIEEIRTMLDEIENPNLEEYENTSDFCDELYRYNLVRVQKIYSEVYDQYKKTKHKEDN